MWPDWRRSLRIDLYTKRIAIVAALVPLALCSACSHALTRSKAADLLKADPEFSKPITMPVAVGGITYAGADVSVQRLLQQHGYLELESTVGNRNYYSYIVKMTSKCEEAVRTQHWKPTTSGEKDFYGRKTPDPQPQTLTIPVGTVSLVEVTGIIGDDKKASADFSEQMTCTDIGTELGCKPEKKSVRHEFTRYDDGWRLDVTKEGN
jgi:hypothetical protein